MYYHGTPGQGDLSGVSPSYLGENPACMEGRRCECEHCTCQECGEKLVWVESLGRTGCQSCDEDVMVEMALETIDSVPDPRGTVMMYTHAFDCRAGDEWWQIQNRSRGGCYEWRDVTETELLFVADRIRRNRAYRQS